jgi:hypothetical protein
MLLQILEKQKIWYIYNIYYMYSKNIIDIDMVKHFFDLEDMKKNVLIFKDKLNALTLINEGDKISFDNDNIIYIDRNHTLQCIKRWYYNENRNNTYEKLSIIFDDYNKFLLMINRSLYNQQNLEFFTIADDVYLFNKNVIKGLYNLKKTYENKEYYDMKLAELIEAIIQYVKQNNVQYLRHTNTIKNIY